MKEVRTGFYTRNGESFDFNFYTDLSVAKKLEFVDSVIGLLVNDNHYNSVIRDLLFDFFVIDVFTDVDITELVNSKNFLEDVEAFLDETNIVEIVKANVSPVLFAELSDAVDKSVQYLTGIHPNPLNEALASLLNTIEDKIGEIDLESMMEMVQKFSGMTEEFTMDNIVNAYMNSGEHKRNLAEIESANNENA